MRFQVATSFCKFHSQRTKITKSKNFKTVILCQMKHCNIVVYQDDVLEYSESNIITSAELLENLL